MSTLFWVCLIPGLLLVSVGILFLVWLLRPNRNFTHPGLSIQCAQVVNDGQHNAFTDLTFWNDSFYLVYISSPSHFANPASRLLILRSADFKSWKKTASLSLPGSDIRDPKIVAIRGSLFVYALLNESYDPKPIATVFAVSKNGEDWSEFEKINPPGWLFGHPKTADERVWYVSAHHAAFDRTGLFVSENGSDWQLCSSVAERKGMDESALEIQTGEITVVSRFEPDGALLGSTANGTLIHRSWPPYTTWIEQPCLAHDRIDSPNLFTYRGELFAVGRWQPGNGGRFHRTGSVFDRRRTAIYKVDTDKVTFVTALPGGGDTAYAGVALRKNLVYISYYSSRLDRDYPWIVGMFSPTNIVTTVINLDELVDVAKLIGR